MRSLAAKLTLAFVTVGLAGALLVALLVGWQTERQFTRYVDDLYAADVESLTEQLQSYYLATGSWAGVKALIVLDRAGGGSPRPMNGHGPPQRRDVVRALTLVDGGGTIVVAGPGYREGQRIAPEQRRAAQPIQVAGETVGWLLLDALRVNGQPPPNSPESNFLGNVWRATLLSALLATGLALVAGAWLARTIARPVRDLTRASHELARGALGRQVPVRTSDELGELATAFNQMSRDLERATTLRRQMTADIAHDLRTPLSALLGYSEALHEGKFQGAPEIYRILHQEAQHLQRLVNDLRTLSLADAGELPLHPVPTAPQALLARVADAHREQADRHAVALHVEAPATLPTLQVDPERMVQVLGNLVSNALRHSNEGGAIWLRGAAAGREVQLQVADNGSGIPPDALPHIWERLYRGNRARPQDGSSGLGLSIARSLVEAQGGTIEVQSRSGVGTTFTLRLPAAPVL